MDPSTFGQVLLIRTVGNAQANETTTIKKNPRASWKKSSTTTPALICLVIAAGNVIFGQYNVTPCLLIAADNKKQRANGKLSPYALCKQPLFGLFICDVLDLSFDIRFGGLDFPFHFQLIVASNSTNGLLCLTCDLIIGIFDSMLQISHNQYLLSLNYVLHLHHEEAPSHQWTILHRAVKERI